ncbi:MAG: DNA/RNA nuclease SfsA [Pseudomonadales bacterium]
MIFDLPLIPATLVRRYKRFLADVELADGQTLTAHCPNTGAMTGCNEPGSAVWLSRSNNPKRKYAHTLEQVASRHGLVGVNTALANRLVKEALEQGVIAELRDYPQWRSEAPIPDGTGRFDFLLHGHRSAPDCYLEVKSVTLAVGDGLGLFPDAVSARARKHTLALTQVARAGKAAALLFCVQHSGIERVAPADQVDPEYGAALREAAAAGVTVIAYRATQSAVASALDTPIPVVLEPPE